MVWSISKEVFCPLNNLAVQPGPGTEQLHPRGWEFAVSETVNNGE